MVRKKVSSSVKVVLSIEDKRKVASFLILLVSVDRRVNNKRAPQKKSKAAGKQYDAELGSHTGPLILPSSKPKGCCCNGRIGLA